MITDRMLKAGLAIFLPAVVTALLPAAIRQKERKIKADYEAEISRLMSQAQCSREEAIQHIRSVMVHPHDPHDIRRDATEYLEGSIGTRLRGAIALYEMGNQLECIRLIFLALGVVCHILEWDEATQYLDEQERRLYQECKKKENAA